MMFRVAAWLACMATGHLWGHWVRGEDGRHQRFCLRCQAMDVHSLREVD